jgi:hypothetical protein
LPRNGDLEICCRTGLKNDKKFQAMTFLDVSLSLPQHNQCAIF